MIMKRILSILTALLFITSGTSQENDYVTLSGKILNANLDSIQLTHWSGFKKTIKVNNDGTFKDTLKVNHFNTFNLSLRRKDNQPTLYLKNGYNLNVAVTTDGYENTVSFSGKGAEANNYLTAKRLNTAAIKGNDIFEFCSRDEDDFATKVTSIKTKNLELLNKMPHLGADFKTFEIQNIKYDELLDYAFYFFLQRNKTAFSKDKNIPEYNAPEGFMPDEFFNFKFDNDLLYQNSASYWQLSFIKLNRSFNIKKVKNEVDIKYLDSVFKIIKIDALKNDMAIQFSRSLLRNKETPEAKTYYHYFINHNQIDKATKQKIKVSYEGSDTKQATLASNTIALKKGDVSPKFVNYKTPNSEAMSLEDFKGKYVYIDVWATWCGPCKKEIPSLKAIEKKYHDKNIEFVSISVDANYAFNTWKKMVKEKELTGIQLFADNAFKSEFIQDYGIRSIPRFILIDPNGNVLESSAPRPSDEKLVTLFDTLDI